MSAEQIYNVLQKESEQQADGQNGGNQSNEDGTEDGSPAQGDPGEPSAPVTDGGSGQLLTHPLQSTAHQPQLMDL
jgi:hypothetical protein